MNDNKGQFEIEFDTEKYPGRIETVQVTLRSAIMTGKDVANLALCEHPLYPALVRYVMANPYRPPVTC
jgi:hypothetical protein